jgi:hypothetical protein
MYQASNVYWLNSIGGVMVSVLVSNAVDRGFEPRSGQTKAFEICICCSSAKHAVLRSKDWLSRNQDNMSEWGDMSICGLLFQWASTIQIQLSKIVLVMIIADIHFKQQSINQWRPTFTEHHVDYWTTHCVSTNMLHLNRNCLKLELVLFILCFLRNIIHTDIFWIS